MQGNDYLTSAEISHVLKRSLTITELETAQKQVEARNSGGKFVVWKFGRSTKFTFGCANPIKSLHNITANGSGMVSKEWAIIHTAANGKTNEFSSKGDSGSLVWDTEGHIVGLLWGGGDTSFVSYATPIETVLEDIKEKCGAETVEMVV